MSTAAEPRDGDFVAYIEELQRESAARILAQSKQVMVELPAVRAPTFGSATGTSASSPGSRPLLPKPSTQFPADGAHRESGAAGNLPLGPLEAGKLLARLAADRATTQQVGAGIALAIGVLLILYWFASRSGVAPLVFGVGLLVWSVRKLRRAASRPPDASATAGRAAITKAFSQRPPDA